MDLVPDVAADLPPLDLRPAEDRGVSSDLAFDPGPDAAPDADLSRPSDANTPGEEADDGCGAATTARSWPWIGLLVLALSLTRRRRNLAGRPRSC